MFPTSSRRSIGKDALARSHLRPFPLPARSHLRPSPLPPVPTCARSHFRPFPLAPVPASARSHLRPFPLATVPTCARSHFRPIPTCARSHFRPVPTCARSHFRPVPTCARPHFRPFPLPARSHLRPFPLAPVPTYVCDALSPLEVSKVALEFGMLLRMSLGDNSAAACPCNSTVTSGRPGPPTLYSIKAGPAADVAGAVCMLFHVSILLYGRATQPSVECKGPGCSKLGGVKRRDRGLVGRALS
jgi:hypothetical protein